ncbi:MAG: cytochrome c peroxidase [Anaeromyxobacteraceae bacterium]
MNALVLALAVAASPAADAALAAAHAADPVLHEARDTFQPLPAAPPPAAPGRIELGKALYFDPRLSASQLISCNTCHNVGLGGADLQATSVGHGWQRGLRNAPTVLNAVHNAAQFWDGRAADLAEQAKGPMQAPVEMANPPARVLSTLRSIPGYPPLFARAFPGEKDPVTLDNVAAAIAAFEATLVTPRAPFDRWLSGEAEAISGEAKAGARLFMEKGCATCHGGAGVGGSGYWTFGLVEAPPEAVRPAADVGRMKVTNDRADAYAFRTPSLRNVALTAPYFHSGAAWTLEEAVAIMATAQTGTRLEPGEVAKIAAFLRTLTGEQPQVSHPVLPRSGAGTPRPALAVTVAER